MLPDVSWGALLFRSMVWGAQLLSRVQLCNPKDHSLPGSSVLGIFFRQEYWSGLPCPPPGDIPNPGIKPGSPVSPSLVDQFFITKPPGKPLQNRPSDNKQ